jgi:hypothetical protein
LRTRRTSPLFSENSPGPSRAKVGDLSQDARQDRRIGGACFIGEISDGEVKDFIGKAIRLDPINLHHLYSSDELLSFFIGKNTPARQEFIIENLRVEKDLVEV